MEIVIFFSIVTFQNSILLYYFIAASSKVDVESVLHLKIRPVKFITREKYTEPPSTLKIPVWYKTHI